MKLIAAKDFPNHPRLKIDLGDDHVKGADGKPLKNHIHKGARFSFGPDAEKFTEVDEKDPDREPLAWLFFTGSVVANNKTNAARIDAEVANEQTRAAADAAASKAAQPLKIEDIVAAVVKAMSAQTAEAAAPAPDPKKKKGADKPDATE